jgi:hypothetical protein
VLRVGSEHLECLLLVDCVTFHQDALCLLDHSTAPERSLKVVIFGEPLQRDLDRALLLLGVGVDDIR